MAPEQPTNRDDPDYIQQLVRYAVYVSRDRPMYQDWKRLGFADEDCDPSLTWAELLRLARDRGLLSQEAG